MNVQQVMPIMNSRISQLITLLLLFLASSICLITSLPSGEFSILNQPENELLLEERVFDLFKQWKERHGKVYEHGQEEDKRYENFRNNLKYVMEKNSKRKSNSEHVVGLNRFADMSNEEFKEVYMSKVIKKKPILNEKKGNKEMMLRSCDAPSSLDWREKGIVTGIKDQGQCGSCWSFSVTGAIEGVNALATGDLISLSEQELVSCDTSNEGCNGGYMDSAFEWVINNGGIDTEADYPYTGLDDTCKISKKNTKAVTIDSYTEVPEEEGALLSAVVNQPVSVGIQGSTADFQLYTGGIYNGECSANPDYIDHAVLIVGYGSQGGDDYWIVKNSWGKSWGIDGYIYIKRNTNKKYGVCGINAMASYPTIESSSSTPPPPPPYPSPISPPPPSLPPPPPSPPNQCSPYTTCPADETCCCLFEFFDYCFHYGCCQYTNGVCCSGTRYCCPGDYPVCDELEGLCYKGEGDKLGVAAKKQKTANYKLPWNEGMKKMDETEKEDHQLLRWKRGDLAAML